MKRDSRLRGLSSITTVSYHVIPAGYDENTSLDSGYKVIYHLLCGGGYGTFTLWQLRLEAHPVVTIVASPEQANGTISDVEKLSFKYDQEWTVVHSGSVNAPTMVNGQVFTTANFSSLGSPSCDFLIQGFEKDASLHASELALSENNTFENPVSTMSNKMSKARSFRGMKNFLAGSTDGMTLFCGENDLLVYR